jgi:hypothetical protein
MSLLLTLVVGRPAAASPDAPGASTTAPRGDGKVDTAATPPPATGPRRHRAAADGRPGESI